MITLPFLRPKTRLMGVQFQQKLTWLKDSKTCVSVLGQQVLRGVVHSSAHAGCHKQLRGEKGSVCRRAAHVRCRVAVEQHVVRSLMRAMGAWGLPGVQQGTASEGGRATAEAHQTGSGRRFTAHTAANTPTLDAL
jgi:hypothetical protein